jgi:hypothetical protein
MGRHDTKLMPREVDREKPRLSVKKVTAEHYFWVEQEDFIWKGHWLVVLEVVVCWLGHCLSFKKSNVLSINQFGLLCIVNSDWTVGDEIFTQALVESAQPRLPQHME